MKPGATAAQAPSVRRLGEAVHPRPQQARASWYELDGTWEFEYDDGDVGLASGWMRAGQAYTRTIQVPFPPESPGSGIGDPSVHQVVWYRRSFKVPQAAAGMRWVLHFGAVDYSADVWLNGSHVCRHAGGHTPFEADITDALRVGDEQVLVVRAEDSIELEQPRGKQHWGEQPEEIWYDRTTGIWQPVWLEAVPALRIQSLRWTPDIANARLRLDLRLSRAPVGPLAVRLVLRRGDVVLVDDRYEASSVSLHREIGLDIGAPSIARRRDLLWSPEYPNLLDAELTVESSGDVLDRVFSYVGLRSVDVTDGAFRLNGWPYYLRLVLDQGYWPESHMAAPDADALRRDVELIKALGFNGVRMHQKIEDPRFLYWCDRLGLLVWEEMPSTYRFSERAAELAVSEWAEVLRRDHSHPCVVTWVAFNESWGVEWLRDRPEMRQLVVALRAMALAVDGTRPVIGNDGWEQGGEEIIGIHDYAAQPSLLRARYGREEHIKETLERVQPNGHPILLPGSHRQHAALVLSEFGGISLRSKGSRAQVFAYGVARDSTALLERWRELFEAVITSRVLAGFCYTQFCDTRQEKNGMVGGDRVPKVSPDKVRKLLQQPPSAIAAEAILHQVLDSGDGEPN
ncbi:MAG: glycoside hydrolase family 2 protein [Candidatus Dormibacteria bacterium]